MRKRMRHYTTAHFALDGVITNGIGGAHCFFDVASFEIFFRMVGPDTGITIGLKLKSDGVFVVIWPIPHRADFIRDTQKLLDMMADFVREDIGLGKVTRCMEGLREFVVKGEINAFYPEPPVNEQKQGSPRAAAPGRFTPSILHI